jgi:hypothetical protein
MKVLVLIGLVMLGALAQAEVLLNCGHGALRLGNGFRKIELQILSANGDFTGKAGSLWFYRFSPAQDWMQEEGSQAFLNQQSELVIKIAASEDLARPAYEYVISDPQADRSTMDQYNLGESEGKVPLKTFVCKKSNVSYDELAVSSKL